MEIQNCFPWKVLYAYCARITLIAAETTYVRVVFVRIHGDVKNLYIGFYCHNKCNGLESLSRILYKMIFY